MTTGQIDSIIFPENVSGEKTDKSFPTPISEFAVLSHPRGDPREEARALHGPLGGGDASLDGVVARVGVSQRRGRRGSQRADGFQNALPVDNGLYSSGKLMIIPLLYKP